MEKSAISQQRWILAARRRLENIAEARSQRLRRRLVCVQVDAALHLDDQRPHIVDPVRMIGVRMCDQHAIQAGRPGVKKLLTQVRRRVDERSRYASMPCALDQN